MPLAPERIVEALRRAGAYVKLAAARVRYTPRAGSELSAILQ